MSRTERHQAILTMANTPAGITAGEVEDAAGVSYTTANRDLWHLANGLDSALVVVARNPNQFRTRDWQVA